MKTGKSELRTQKSAGPAFGRNCRNCDHGTTVCNGRPGELLCANHPDHSGQLTLVASGDAILEDAGSRCRSFRIRRERVAAGDLPADDSVRYIDLGDGAFAIVDAADCEWLNKYRWRTIGAGYAGAQIGGKAVLMHRLIMKPPAGKVVDHINGNRKDNRRSNLRECTQAENRRNVRKLRGASRFKGVSWHRQMGKWQAKICHNGKSIHLGLFHDEVEAARAYDKAAREFFGVFACLNFPDFGNIVRLAGRICVHSNARGRLRVRKSETRNPKFETTSNVQSSKSKTTPRGARAFGALGCRSWVLFRVSYFGFRIWPSSRGPPGEKAQRNRPYSNRGWEVDRGAMGGILSRLYTNGKWSQGT